MKKLLICGYVFLSAMLLFGVTAEAYIDPSVMTYVIQAVAGVVIAVGAVIGIYWKKAKKKAQEGLGLKEKKGWESDDIFLTEEEEKAK